MPIVCVHCRFPVAHDPSAGAPPAHCPQCGEPITTDVDHLEAPSASPSLATFLNVSAAPTDAEHRPAQEEAPADAHAVADIAPSPDALPIADDAAEAEPTDATVAHMDDASTDASAQVDVVVEEAAASDAEPMPVVAPIRARAAQGPRFLHRARTTPVHAARRHWQWTAVAALALLLCVQVVIADRGRLATQAGWRPVVVALCGVFRCDVPTWREPAAFTMLSRDVRPILGQSGTLQAQATFRNEARWAQAWPVILLTLKDADGRTLGARALQPADYLPEDEALTSIGPGQSAQMAVRIREPSANVVAFSFDFR